MHAGVQGVARRLAAPAAVLAALAAPTAALAAHRAPRTTILSGPAPRVAMRTVTFTFTANAARGVRYSWRVDGHRWSRFTSRTYATLKHLRAGTHVFQVRARSGRVVARRAARAAFVVDLTPPQTTLRRREPRRGRDRPLGRLPVPLERDEAGLRVQPRPARATAPAPRRSSLTGLAVGRHRLAVRSLDPAGERRPDAGRAPLRRRRRGAGRLALQRRLRDRQPLALGRHDGRRRDGVGAERGRQDGLASPAASASPPPRARSRTGAPRSPRASPTSA